jgi:predicted DNA-binding protein with PD1-like motif
MSDAVYSMSAELGRRVVRHPGTPAVRRVWTNSAAGADEFEAELPVGTDLFSALMATLDARGCDHGNLVALRGELSVAKCQTGYPDPKGEIAAVYRAPIEFEGGATILDGNGTIGHRLDGGPIIHCHAVLIDRMGHAFAGHLPTDLCIIGGKGVTVRILVPRDGGFVVRPDPETHVALLAPVEQEGTAR